VSSGQKILLEVLVPEDSWANRDGFRGIVWVPPIRCNSVCCQATNIVAPAASIIERFDRRSNKAISSEGLHGSRETVPDKCGKVPRHRTPISENDFRDIELIAEAVKREAEGDWSNLTWVLEEWEA
jgi:hypothetical protein